MPTSTPDQEDEKLNPARNVGQDEFDKIIDKNFSPGDERAVEQSAESGAARDLAEREAEASSVESDSSSTGEDQSTSLADQEQTGDAGWKNSTSPGTESKGGRVKKIRALASRGKLVYAMIGIGFAVLGLMFSFLSGALGIVQIKENLVSKMSQRAADALDNRKNRIMAKKFSKDLTSGSCTVIKVKCRYRGFTNRELKKFNTRAQKAGLPYRLAEDGRRGLLKNAVKLEKYDINDTSDNPRAVSTVAAGDVYNEIRKNPQLRKAAGLFYKGNVEYHAGRVGVNTLNKLKVFRGKKKIVAGQGATDLEKEAYSRRAEVRQAVSGEDASLNPAQVGDGLTPEENTESNKINGEVKDVIQENIDQEKAIVDDYTKSGEDPPVGSDAYNQKYQSTTEAIRTKGGGVTSIVGSGFEFMQNICMMRMLAGAVNNTRSIIQVFQLARFAGTIAVLADQIKAGDADNDTQKKVGIYMGMLMAKDARGHTAFDSLGYNWVMSKGGSVRGTPNEDIGRFRAGGQPPGILGKTVSNIVRDDGLKGGCKIAMSKTATAIGIGFSVAGFLTGGLANGLKTAATQTFRKVVQKEVKEGVEDALEKEIQKSLMRKELARYALSGTMDALFYLGAPPIIAGLAKNLAGSTLTGDQIGPDLGNAMVSGFGGMVALTSKSQGLMPLTPKRAAASDRFAYENQLKIAKEEGINQLDINNEFSFLNKFASLLVPVQTKLSSFYSVPSAVASLQSLAISQTLPVSKAEDIEKQYTFCTKQDEEYAEKNIATDPMCNPVFGFIGSYLKSVDPEDVVDYLVAQNLINEEGEPIGDFVDFIETCMNSNTPLGEDIDLCLKGGGLSDKTFASDNPSSNSMLSEKALAAASIDELGEEDKKYAMMRLYCLDTSVDVDMNEGEGVSCSEEIAGGSADTPLNESVEFAGDGDLKKVIKASSPRKWAMIPAEHVCSLSERPNTENGGNIQIDARILPNLKYLASKYNMCVTAGLSGTHNSHGAGLGVDMVPKNGNSKSDWENSVEKAAKDIGWWGDGVNDPKGSKPSCEQYSGYGRCMYVNYPDRIPKWVRWMGYNGSTCHGDPWHIFGGCNPHIHIGWHTPNNDGASSGIISQPRESVYVFPVKDASDSL